MLDLRLFAGNTFFYPTTDNLYLSYKSIGKSDRANLIDGFNRLSPTSVYHRFFGFLSELSENQLDKLLSIDNKTHVAWAAFDIVNEKPLGVGVGRFRRPDIRATEAELALTVVDDYQGKGIGTVLLGIMYSLAIKLQIETFTGIIMSENDKLIRRFYQLGAQFTRNGSEYEMRLPVFQNFNDIPNSAYKHALIPILEFLQENDFCA